MRIKEVMKSVQVINGESSIRDAASLMSKQKIGSLIVLNGKSLSGIITERDILTRVTANNKLPEKVMIKNVMTPKMITIDSEALIDDAVYLMLKHKIKRLPVTSEKKLVGMITSTDIMANSDELGQFYFFE
mgnify:CR=1 FL=1